MASVNPSSVANMDPQFETQLRSLRTQAQAEASQGRQGDQVQWLIPDRNGWNGDLFDWQGMAKPFDRSQANQDFVQATSDPQNPGNVGDLIVTTTQIDYLAVMERAFRMRHTMRRPRAMAHALGRKAGHGNDAGTFSQCGLEYVRGILKQSKGA